MCPNPCPKIKTSLPFVKFPQFFVHDVWCRTQNVTNLHVLTFGSYPITSRPIRGTSEGGLSGSPLRRQLEPGLRSE